jgi:hypothetical protein
MSINRPPYFIGPTMATTAGPITVPAAPAPQTQVGDVVVGGWLASSGALVGPGLVEQIISVPGQIQQTGVLTAATYNFLILPQGWKSIQ